MSPDLTNLLLFAAFVVVILGMMIFGNRNSMIGKMGRVKTMHLKDFKDGEVGKFMGEIHTAREHLVAPISRQKCVGYEVHVLSKNDKNQRHLLTVKRFNDAIVIRGGLHAVVAEKDAQVEINQSIDVYTSLFTDTEDHIKLFLEENGIRVKNFFGLNNAFEITEGILHIGEYVAVMGQGHWVEKPIPNNPSETVRYLVMKPTEKNPVFLTDKPTYDKHAL
ncbi:MAG: hypothetical protein AAF193_07295 [Bacteroidota bacterium]